MTFDSFLKILRRYWLILVAGLVLGTVVALGISWIQPKVYSADSSGFITTASTSNEGSVGTALAGDSYAKSRAKSYADLGTKRVVAEQVIKDLRLSTTPEDLVENITVTVPTDTVTIKVTAKASTPRGASDLANEWIVAMAAQIKQLEDGGSNNNQAVVTLTPLESAALPTSPSSPNIKLNVAFGLLIGLVIGAGVALLRKQYDRRIRSTSDVTTITQVPIVGTLPAERELVDAESRLVSTDLEGAYDTRRSSSTRQFDEGMRELRTNLEFLDVDNPPRSIVVTSAVPSEGKSTVAANLAATIAETGRKVVLIDGDLRRPTMAKTFGIPGEVGLTDLLAGRLDLEAVLQPWRDGSSLFLLPAGSIPPNPSELLGSSSFHELVAELINQSATVIIDSPPLLPVTDAAVLTARNDGALVVISAGRTSVDELTGALAALDKVKGKALGIVLNRVPTTGADKYGYKYYRGDYYYDSVDETGKHEKHRRKGKEHEPATASAPSGMKPRRAQGAASPSQS